MLDYNRRPSFADRVNATVDQALTADQATRPPRDYTLMIFSSGCLI